MTHSLAHSPAGLHALPWLESFAVGHEALDEEHQDLLASCNDLCALALAEPDSAVVRRAASGLIAKVECHFAREEAVFPLINYDRRLSHMREHLAVINNLQKLLFGSMDVVVAANSSRLVLVEHILRHDLQFKTWVLHAKGI